ncbi:Telomerase reverse transcriptase [Coemansia spiralis]|uniref:Telomerase reverse transcriptase n=2 Tax=Coemansia TaxID=4863 RepID=A0A9W8G801_9FUNG|nr:Telomerase reverse transcriptase [Coemansia sp. RSA 1358]KAJ2678119.1 Telomerase reverse transcriptase [Coemansia spiralis]
MYALVEDCQCLREADSPEFKRFLTTTLVGHRIINRRLKLECPIEKLADTVIKSIKWMIESEPRLPSCIGHRRNILALGYDMCQDGSTNWVKGIQELSNHHINSSMIELGRHRWQLLLERTGTVAMMHLLRHTSIFIPLHNSSFKQICGTPLVNLAMPPANKMYDPIFSTTAAYPGLRKGKRKQKDAESNDDFSRICNVQSSSKTRKIDTCQLASAQQQQQRTPLFSSITTSDSAKSSFLATDPPINSITLSTIPVDRIKMLYCVPRTSQHKVRWNLSPDFALNICKSPEDLLARIFSKIPNMAEHPPERLILLCKRMLKLHKEFNYRFHLFRQCPAPWQTADRGSEAMLFPTTRPENLFDSDNDEDDNLTIPVNSVPIPTQISPCSLDKSTPSSSLAGPFDRIHPPSELDIVSNVAVGVGDIGSSAERFALSGVERPKQNPPVKAVAANNGTKDDAASFLKMASSQHQIYMYLQLCIRSVIPRDLIGGKHNHRRLYKMLHALVHAGRYDDLSLHQAIQKLKLGEVKSWLDPQQPTAASMYACLIHWVLSGFAIQLIRGFFYVTEGSSTGNRLYFFRNDVWNSITRNAWKTLISDMFVHKARADVATDGKRWQRFGYSRMRLMPKERGFRAIANLKQSFILRKLNCSRNKGKQQVVFKEQHIQSTNKTLSNAMAAINYVRRSRPELFGSAIFGPDDAYERIKQFKDMTKDEWEYGKSRLFIAKMDIRRAYDTIPQGKLLTLLKEKLPDEEYTIFKYWTLSPSYGHRKPLFLRHAMPSCKSVPFGELAYSLSKNAKQLVFGDQSATDFIDTQAIYDLVSEHVTHNTVKAAWSILQQRRGIPQGSVLSSHLCNFFYAQLECEYLYKLIDPKKTLLLRIVDDFIIISTDRAQVAVLLEVLHKGIPEYGCEVNKAKTLANFDICVGGHPVDKTSSSRFPWCGILIDDSTLNVFVDYGRQARGPGIESTLNFGTAKSPGLLLRHRMLASVRVRMHRLYMDSKFNSKETVLLNLYQNFLVCAKKFHAVCQRILTHRNNCDFLIKVIDNVVTRAFVLLKKRCRDRLIPPADVTWLGLFAFRKILSRKQARHTKLIKLLDSRLAQPKISRIARRYRNITDSPLNDMVNSIAY